MIDTRLMNHKNGGGSLAARARRPLLAMSFLVAAATVPLAFAQVDPAVTPQPQPQQQGEPTMDAATLAETPPTTEPPPASEMRVSEEADTTATELDEASDTHSASQQGWEEVDTDRDGNISREEAASNAGLGQIFDEADANADGMLTPVEYREFVEKNHSEPQTP